MIKYTKKDYEKYQLVLASFVQADILAWLEDNECDIDMIDAVKSMTVNDIMELYKSDLSYAYWDEAQFNFTMDSIYDDIKTFMEKKK